MQLAAFADRFPGASFLLLLIGCPGKGDDGVDSKPTPDTGDCTQTS